MTPSEGFEKWWKINAPSFGPILAWDKDNRKKQMVKDTWLAACQFQRERDAEIADSMAEGCMEGYIIPDHTEQRDSCGEEIATTIREQE